MDLSIELDWNSLADSNYPRPIGYFAHSFSSSWSLTPRVWPLSEPAQTEKDHPDPPLPQLAKAKPILPTEGVLVKPGKHLGFGEA